VQRIAAANRGVFFSLVAKRQFSDLYLNANSHIIALIILYYITQYLPAVYANVYEIKNQ